MFEADLLKHKWNTIATVATYLPFTHSRVLSLVVISVYDNSFEKLNTKCGIFIYHTGCFNYELRILDEFNDDIQRSRIGLRVTVSKIITGPQNLPLYWFFTLYRKPGTIYLKINHFSALNTFCVNFIYVKHTTVPKYILFILWPLLMIARLSDFMLIECLLKREMQENNIFASCDLTYLQSS